jgi:flavin-dependent dehydrogenase
VIAGGGPAGCALALSLRTHAPQLSVALIEPSDYGSIRPGEVLPGAARRLLSSLDIWHAFQQETWRPVYAVAAAWGSPVLRENHSIYSMPGHGWHLDRAKFDRFLAQQAETRGVAVFRTAVQEVRGAAGAWAVGPELHARFISDATGRSAFLARRLGGSIVSVDPLVGFSRFFPATDGSDPRTLIEAVPDGWWYTASLTGGLRVATFMTDPEIARQEHLDRETGWREALAQTTFIRAAVPDGASVGEVVRPAGSAYLEDPAGDGWIAVGDAAYAHDPLSGQGITRALRSGILASYAVADVLCHGSSLGLDKYRYLMRHGWFGYLTARQRNYAEEGRWPEGSFWKTRQPSNES